MGYTHCTAVQAESLGPLLSGADMVVKAKTGTGKTLAFLIPGIEQASSSISLSESCERTVVQTEHQFLPLLGYTAGHMAKIRGTE